jgi:hypothetical protein
MCKLKISGARRAMEKPISILYQRLLIIVHRPSLLRR